MEFPGTIRVRVTTRGLPAPMQVSVCSAVNVKRSSDKTIMFLNAEAKRRGVDALYELATEDEYWAYRKQLQDTIAAAKTV